VAGYGAAAAEELPMATARSLPTGGASDVIGARGSPTTCAHANTGVGGGHGCPASHASNLLSLLGSDGPGGLERLGWSDRVELTNAGSAENKRKGLLFCEFNFQCENNSKKF
jgi:hypothetical protein